MSNISERETREQLIDKQLKAVGWLKSYIKEEVNSVRSKFKIKEYILSQGQGDDSGRFIDYLLLAEDNSPIALIEAKKFSVSEDKGRAQARTYLKDIENQMGRKKAARFGPRIIDLDILLYADKFMHSKKLVIPHPRMFTRDFVIKPLMEVL